MKKTTLFIVISIIIIFLMPPQAKAQNHVFDSLTNEINRLTPLQSTKALELLQELYQMAYNDPDSSLLIAHCLYEESVLNFRQRLIDTALVVRINEKLDREDIPPFEKALLQFTAGINLIITGEYADAFPILIEVLEVFKQHNHNILTARTLNSLGIIYHAINLRVMAEHYYTEAMKYISPNYAGYYFLKLNTFLILSYQDIEVAVDSLQSLIDFAEKENMENLLPILYINIGGLLLDTYPERAFAFFTKIQKMDFDNPGLTAILYANLGIYYSRKKDYEKALYYLKEALKIMEQNNDFQNLPTLYHNISSIYEQQRNYKNALFYSQKNQETIMKIRSNMAAIEAYQKYVSAFLEASQKELIIAEQTIKLKNKQFVIIVIISSFTVLLVLLFLLLAHQQKLRKVSENRELSAKLEHEKKVQQYEKRQRKLEHEKQEAMLDAKTREVTSYSMLVSNKNSILKQIKELNMHICDGEEIQKNAKKVDEVIQNNLNIDEEWKNFIVHFDKVHPHFFEKLKQYHSDLTEENLKMCAYIKMRMTTKQIAQLFHVVPRSIITNRHRLKKKLQLDDDMDLDDFIGNL